MRSDTMIANGRIVEGTGGSAYTADLGITNGRIAAIGRLKDAEAAQRIDASGKIVAPGHIANHAHYDVALFWDSYCSNSGKNGITTVANANCGFGIAPVKPSDRKRTMLRTGNTEQIPVPSTRSQPSNAGQWPRRLTAPPATTLGDVNDRRRSWNGS